MQRGWVKETRSRMITEGRNGVDICEDSHGAILTVPPCLRITGACVPESKKQDKSFWVGNV